MGSEDIEGEEIGPSKDLAAPNAPAAMPDIYRWITTEYGKVGKKPIDRIRLLKRAVDGASVHVYSWQEEDFESGPDSLLENIYEKAVTEARHQPGKVPFLLQIVYKDKKYEDISQRFEVQGQGHRDGEDDFGNEPASPKGLIAQLMRHTEAMTRLALVSSREGITTLQRQNEEKDRQISQLLSLHLQVIEVHSRLKDKEFERDMEREDKKAMRQLKTGLLEEGIKKLPEVIQMFAPKNGQAEEFLKQAATLLDILGEDGMHRMIHALLAPDANGVVDPENQKKAEALATVLQGLLQMRQQAAGPKPPT